ncbi:unnamed protein product [Schistosoma curassoni]|uniref:Uncharacterized protein n=1 Tax=Schistosoma curassoni TaxID=6186 RepID=A0A183KF22_9TREM|nr:unnamed protein product [Schistosoma curassoni]
MHMKATGIAAASASVGLIIQNGKCKISKCNTENTNPITLDEEALESFAYLNSIIDKQGRSDADVKARIGKARTALLQSKNIWNSKQLSTNIKRLITILNFIGLMNTKTILGERGFGHSELDYLNDIQLAIQRMGKPDEFSSCVMNILQNPMINGVTLRLDGGGRLIFL